MKNKKTLFVISTDHSIDLITNSSSELFVLQGKTLEHVREAVSDLYPDYRNEYEEIVALRDTDNSNLETYLDYNYGHYRQLIDGFTFEEMYEVPAWLIKMRNERNDKTPYRKDDYQIKDGFVENNRERILDALDPNGTKFMMFSSDENPDWDMQEKLMGIGERHHLG